jgi:hypothetical protein
MFVDAVIHTSRREQHSGGAGGGRAARRQERADRVRAGGARQVRAAFRHHRAAAERLVEITSGLREGENVVADGSLFLQFANAIQ